MTGSIIRLIDHDTIHTQPLIVRFSEIAVGAIFVGVNNHKPALKTSDDTFMTRHGRNWHVTDVWKEDWNPLVRIPRVTTIEVEL